MDGVDRSGKAHGEGSRSLARLAARWADFGPPIIAVNKSHSGSRLLARLLSAAGVFMGAERNDSEDAADMLRLVRPMVERHFPDYGTLFREGDRDLESLAEDVLAKHLADHRKGERWGWKLCETLYILPILQQIFPTARVVHIVRDGRDVAFADHVAPAEPFWRKVYFETDAISSWNGRALSEKAYRRTPHVFNARHWVSSVTTARHYGAMLGERYCEIRYEDLVLDGDTTTRRLLGELGLVMDEAAITRFLGALRRDSVGKHRARPRRERVDVLKVLEPTLTSFGYGDREGPVETPWRRWLARN